MRALHKKDDCSVCCLNTDIQMNRRKPTAPMSCSFIFLSDIFQTAHSRDNTGAVYFIVVGGYFSRMWSPRQLTHLPPVWDSLLPIA